MGRGRTIAEGAGAAAWWHLGLIPLLVMFANGAPRRPAGTVRWEGGVPFHTDCGFPVTKVSDGVFECDECEDEDGRPLTIDTRADDDANPGVI